jgi:cyclopropane fatty-acyl-phospholipid synthase-like methyltransferase
VLGKFVDLPHEAQEKTRGLDDARWIAELEWQLRRSEGAIAPPPADYRKSRMKLRDSIDSSAQRVPRASADARRLTTFYGEVYGEMTSVQEVLRVLGRSGDKPGTVKAADLYTRSLDCQNHGGYGMLQRIAAVAAPHGELRARVRVLDVGCGVGGPGRFLADRYGCHVIGIDVVLERVRAATALTKLTGLTRKVSHRQADATALPYPDSVFHQVWMLDASVHVRHKAALFGELARVLKQGGLLVLHDQWGLPPAMRPVMRRAPYFAPTLGQLLRHLERAGFRLLAWQDTTAQTLAYMQQPRNGRLDQQVKSATTGADRKRYQRSLQLRDAYVEALSVQGSRTGVLVAERKQKILS